MSKYFPTSVDPTYPDASLAINLAGVYMVKVGLHDHSQAATTGLQHRLKFWTIDRVARMKMGNEKCVGKGTPSSIWGQKQRKAEQAKPAPRATAQNAPPESPLPLVRLFQYLADRRHRSCSRGVLFG